MSDDGDNRKLFHSNEGRIQWARLFEQAIPAAVMAIIVIYANSKVTESQISTLKDEAASIRVELKTTIDRVSNQNGEIVRLQAQTAAYLATQNQLNGAMDERIRFFERAARPVR